MKITTSQLRRIIKEEVARVIAENAGIDSAVKKIENDPEGVLKKVFEENPELAAQIAAMDASKLQAQLDKMSQSVQAEGFFDKTKKGIERMKKDPDRMKLMGVIGGGLTGASAAAGALAGALGNAVAGSSGMLDTPAGWAAIMAALMAAGMTAHEIKRQAEWAQEDESEGRNVGESIDRLIRRYSK